LQHQRFYRHKNMARCVRSGNERCENSIMSHPSACRNWSSN
jgi:hypothetical protein